MKKYGCKDTWITHQKGCTSIWWATKQLNTQRRLVESRYRLTGLSMTFKSQREANADSANLKTKQVEKTTSIRHSNYLVRRSISQDRRLLTHSLRIKCTSSPARLNVSWDRIQRQVKDQGPQEYGTLRNWMPLQISRRKWWATYFLDNPLATVTAATTPQKSVKLTLDTAVVLKRE